jgi:hypothetical protein
MPKGPFPLVGGSAARTGPAAALGRVREAENGVGRRGGVAGQDLLQARGLRDDPQPGPGVLNRPMSAARDRDTWAISHSMPLSRTSSLLSRRKLLESTTPSSVEIVSGTSMCQR